LLGSGLEPDVWVEIDPAEEAQAFHAAWTRGAAAVISEPPALPRLQHDISAIVLDAGVASAPTPGPVDPILRAGIDAVTAIQVRLASPTSAPSLPKNP
jgi:hypothetical protein